MMTHMLLLLAPAWADPGRVFAGLEAGATLDGAPVIRGAADLGVAPALSLAGEAAAMPSGRAVALGCGLLVSPADGPWGRAGIYVGPEIALPWDGAAEPGWAVPLAPSGTALQARAGVRVAWVLAWGVALTARLDRVQPLSADRGRSEAAAGIAVRL